MLSASKLADLDKCSWIYYCKYILKIPDEANDGSRRGNCVHNLCECLLNKRHIKLYNQIVQAGTITKAPAAEKFIRKQDILGKLCKPNHHDPRGKWAWLTSYPRYAGSTGYGDSGDH